jgi:nucleoside diphosphate kinase
MIAHMAVDASIATAAQRLIAAARIAGQVDVAQAHAGTIRAESAEGTTTFQIASARDLTSDDAFSMSAFGR